MALSVAEQERSQRHGARERRPPRGGPSHPEQPHSQAYGKPRSVVSVVLLVGLSMCVQPMVITRKMLVDSHIELLLSMLKQDGEFAVLMEDDSKSRITQILRYPPTQRRNCTALSVWIQCRKRRKHIESQQLCFRSSKCRCARRGW